MPKYSKNDITTYYEILGIDPKEEGLVIADSINLNEIGDLYYLNEFDKKLSYTSEELSKVYSLLYMMIKDGFWYNTKKRRENALVSTIEIINDLTNFDIEDINDEELTNDRKNNLKAAIIKGLCSCEDIINLRFYQKNATFNSIYSKIKDTELKDLNNIKFGMDEDQTPENLMILYYLIAYSKFDNNGCDLDMFDGTGQITLPKIRNLVKRNIREEVSISDMERGSNTNKKILRISKYQKKED